MSVCVGRDGRRSVGRRLLREQFGAEEPRVENRGADAKRRDLRGERLHPALQAELGGGVGGIERKAREPASDEIEMIWPERCWRMTGRTARVTLIGPISPVASGRSICSEQGVDPYRAGKPVSRPLTGRS